MFMVVPANAFLYEVGILTTEEIEDLKDDKLLEVYTEAMIERKASETFHGRAGFAPKEYAAYKQLLGLISRIRQEMSTRELDVPPIDEWIR